AMLVSNLPGTHVVSQSSFVLCSTIFLRRACETVRVGVLTDCLCGSGVVLGNECVETLLVCDVSLDSVDIGQHGVQLGAVLRGLVSQGNALGFVQELVALLNQVR